MADDGMLLNFSAAGDISTGLLTPKFKGGSWRERARLKYAAKTRSTGANAEPAIKGTEQAYQRAIKGGASSLNTDHDYPRPSKRRRENGEFVPSSKQSVPRPANEDASAPKKQTGSREVISSLFSYNPQPKENEDIAQEEKDQQLAIPSNAPLPDGIDTFTSLGLSPTIAAHLLTKMGLKTPTAIQKATVSQLIEDDSDAFIQSETGSGKTLAYLLPIVQRLMKMSEHANKSPSTVQSTALHRDSGLFTIILAPTRELCKQISVVLEKLLGCAHYIVAGTVLGGEKKKSEKARLRKGINILVATPGRLVDHLENTETLDVSKVRFLVLDEGDRLMDLGFEEDIGKIVRTLDSKKRKSTRPGLPEKRITMLCSATLKTTVQKLGDISLKDAILIKGDSSDPDAAEGEPDGIDSAFLAPAQLKQSYIVAAAKLRLVTLTALVKRTFARKGSVMKAIVFVSCADSVEFHFKAFTRSAESGQEKTSDTEEDASKRVLEGLKDAVAPSPLLSDPVNPLTIYKLHGSLPQTSRTAIVKAFATTSQPSLLIATDVAARGLDLPNLDLVIEYDPAFSTDDHLHRIGRTARLGRDGRAVIFLLPGKEEGYVEVLKKSYKNDVGAVSNVTSTPADEIMRRGFTPTSGIVSSQKSWESRATDFQLDIERWVLADPATKELAKKAFQSEIRAYATHIASERQWFDIKDLHLGHLAKSFGLRDPPGKVNVAGVGRKNASSARPRANESRKRQNDNDIPIKIPAQAEVDATVDADEAARKMRDMVRNRKKMMGAGADEFNLA